MKRINAVGLGLGLWAMLFLGTACDDDDGGEDTMGDADDDGGDGNDDGGDGGSVPECVELAQKCPLCTLPFIKTVCEGAVDTNDADSCLDGLDDPDIISNCVP